MRGYTKIKNIISLHGVTVNGNEVVVSYLFKSNPLEAKLDPDGLKLFALNRGIDASINAIVLSYLYEYPLESVSLQLDAMVLRLTA